MMDELNKFEKQPVVEPHKSLAMSHIMKMWAGHQCWLVTEEAAFDEVQNCHTVGGVFSLES